MTSSKNKGADEVFIGLTFKVTGPTIVSFSVRAAKLEESVKNLMADFKHGIRVLRRNWLFSLAAVATLSLGICANTSVFTIVNTVLIKPLPFQNSERLVVVSETAPKSGQAVPVAPANAYDFGKLQDVFEQSIVYKRDSFNLSGQGNPLHVEISVVSPAFFDFFQVPPFRGRTFTGSDGDAGQTGVMVLSHQFWQQYFGGREDVLGKTIRLDGDPYEIVGVAPASFKYPTVEAAGWTASRFHANSTELRWRGSHFLQFIGRLQPGVTLKLAATKLEAVATQLSQQYPITNKGWGVKVGSFQEELTGDVHSAMLMLLGAVMFVLLIACSNIANLLLARASGREREISLRLALGAGRGQVTQQLLVEAVLLSLLGGTLGYLLAIVCIRAGRSLLPASLSLFGDPHPDATVALFCLLLSCGAGIVFGILPALQSGKTAPSSVLKTTRGFSGIRSQRSQNIIIVSEVAMALVLVAGAFLVQRSLHGLIQTDPGFNPKDLLTMAVSLPQTHYPKVDLISNFYRQSLDFLHSMPNVEDAAVTNTLPTGHHSTNIFAFERSNESHFAVYYLVSPTYFHTMQIPIKHGRPFAQEDLRTAPLAVIVNEAFVKSFLNDEDPLHKRIKLTPPNQEGPWREIVGVASNTRDFGLDKPALPAVFLPLEQDLPHATDMNLVVRTGSSHFEATISAMKSEIESLDKDEPVFDIMPMEQVLQSTLHQSRVVLALLTSFAAASLLLAAVGIFGLMSYLVSQRTAEIGVRMALGADRTNIVYFVLKRSTKLVCIGVMVGVIAAAVLGKMLTASFSTIHPLDPLAWIGSVFTLLIVALIASYLPARKAANLDPAMALRTE